MCTGPTFLVEASSKAASEVDCVSQVIPDTLYTQSIRRFEVVIRRSIIGSTVLFTASGCWGPTPAKVVPDTTIDSVESDLKASDSSVTDDASDGDTCYESPSDPLQLVGSSCDWPEHVECESEGKIIPEGQVFVQCLDGTWTEQSLENNDGEACYCESSSTDCEPPILYCEFLGVGFLGINVAGWDRRATRSLRLV